MANLETKTSPLVSLGLEAARKPRKGLFLSSEKSMQNLSKTGKLRACPKITLPHLGFVKIYREDKNQP
jgi:hypothetical protein